MSTSFHDLINRTPRLPCRDNPGPWYSELAASRAWAQQQCRTCPVRVACAKHAIQTREQWGVWGATTAMERRSFWEESSWRFDELGRLRKDCGSEQAYRTHIVYHETPCAACVAAHETHSMAKRRKRLAREHELPGGGSARGFLVHRSLHEPPCKACWRAWRDQCAATLLAQSAAHSRAQGIRSPQSRASGRSKPLSVLSREQGPDT